MLRSLGRELKPIVCYSPTILNLYFLSISFLCSHGYGELLLTIYIGLMEQKGMKIDDDDNNNHKAGGSSGRKSSDSGRHHKDKPSLGERIKSKLHRH